MTIKLVCDNCQSDHDVKRFLFLEVHIEHKETPGATVSGVLRSGSVLPLLSQRVKRDLCYNCRDRVLEVLNTVVPLVGAET